MAMVVGVAEVTVVNLAVADVDNGGAKVDAAAVAVAVVRAR